jgi:hypothetical protein
MSQEPQLFVIQSQYEWQGKWRVTDTIVRMVTEENANKMAKERLAEDKKPYDTYGGLVSFGPNNVKRRVRIFRVVDEVVIE